MCRNPGPAAGSHNGGTAELDLQSDAKDLAAVTGESESMADPCWRMAVSPKERYGRGNDQHGMVYGRYGGSSPSASLGGTRDHSRSTRKRPSPRITMRVRKDSSQAEAM